MKRDRIWNVSLTKLTESEVSYLNEGLSFCPTMNEHIKELLLGNQYSCRKLELKKHFYSDGTITKMIQQVERNM